MASGIPTIAVSLLSRWVSLSHLSVVHCYTWMGHGSESGVLRDSRGADGSEDHTGVRTYTYILPLMERDLDNGK